MGNASSAKSSVKTLLENVTNICTENIQKCAMNPANSAEIIQSNINGNNEITKAVIAQYVSVSQDCFSKATLTTDQETKIKEAIENSSKATTGAIAFMSKAKSKTMTEMITKLATNIHTAFVQEVNNSSKNIVKIVQANVNGNNIIKEVDIKQEMFAIQKAIQESDGVVKAKTEVDTMIKAEAEATVKGLEDCLWQIIIILIICAVGYMMMQGMLGGMASNTTMLLIILTAVFGYFTVAYSWNGNIPYWFFTEDDTKKKAFIVFLCIFLVLAAILVIKFFPGKPSQQTSPQIPQYFYQPQPQSQPQSVIIPPVQPVVAQFRSNKRKRRSTKKRSSRR